MPGLILNGSRIAVERESRRLILRRQTEDQTPDRTLEVPLLDVERVTVVGHPHLPVATLQTLLHENIPVSFVTETGRWLGHLSPGGDCNAARRILQYEQHQQPQHRLQIAQRIIEAKITNSRRVLQRLAANRKETHLFRHLQILGELRQYRRKCRQTASLEELRGIEGVAAARYFERLANFFPAETPFQGRNRRPPKDPANALLSWTYTILLSEIQAGVQIHGLDPALGCLHEIAPGSPSLALDLLEPLRAPVCDLLVLNILNHRLLTAKDFFRSAEDGGCYLREESRKKFFIAYESAMQRKFQLERGGNHTDFRQILRSQIFHYLRCLEEPDNPAGDFFYMP
jgi:CRISPR-associated protein Cas1